MTKERKNRLAGETSPYLLQHASNPVDWYPWCPEALERARREDLPIFLSVGYAACHWCHVMERESFESEEIARLLNENFVSIKVDREERPDIDEIYMQSVQLVTGSGGWPMSVFLTPDGRPFYGGTYFPPEDGFGRPGFRSVILQLSEAWRSKRREVEESADRIAEALRHALGRGGGQAGEPTAALLEGAVADLERRFDAHDGGFSPAPKFPHADAILLLLRHAERTGSEHARGMALRTLDAIDRGGIHDQAGGGFHRYSTDPRWLVPHFEKMLYDQALLVRAYLEAWRQTGEERWGRPARRACDWVIRDMTGEGGGLHSTLDADSEGEEGKFYVWTPESLRQVLEASGASSEEAGRYLNWYGVEGPPNFEGAWILHRPRTLEDFVRQDGVGASEWRERSDRLDEAVRSAREKRVWPGKDDKVLAAWNGLMIGSLARAGGLLEEERYLDAAGAAARFVLEEMRVEGRLHRAWRDGRLSNLGYLEDYAFLAEGLLDLHEATGEGVWLVEARSLCVEAVRLFRDHAEGCWYFTGHDGEDLLVRSRAVYDGATPAGVSVMADVLLRLGGATAEAEWKESGVEILSGQKVAMQRYPGAYSTMLLAVDRLVREEGHADLGGRAPLPAVEASAAGPVAPGGSVEVRVEVRAPEGWTVAVAEGKDGYEPLALRLPVRSGGWTLEPGTITATGEGAQVGEAGMTARLEAPGEAAAGRVELTLVLRYQLCGEGVCQPPAELFLLLPLEVEG